MYFYSFYFEAWNTLEKWRKMKELRTTYPCRDGKETICAKAQNLQECGVVGRLPSTLVTRVRTHRKLMIDTCVLSHVSL